MEISTVLVDRDGTLGGDGHFKTPENFKPYPGVVAAISRLKRQHILVLAITNQTQIAAGKISMTEVRQGLAQLGITDSWICPHQASQHCQCRKPQPLLVYEAQKQYHFDLATTAYIGDSYRYDMQLAVNAGMLGIHVATGRIEPAGKQQCLEQPDFVSAVDWILNGL
ncbi:HAD-IIIA family hydrolase [Lactiplantibacillus herbarum]|uniref:HAD-IIIA family hydrolase n=1 Tax=Lactiplantibacillus herbarum TaxID=1670446 RepID=UPI00064E5737|nr:HAD-IIIA family hydrolase [Lactiplantibacillus herbarum]